jgi:hypothetical protein
VSNTAFISGAVGVATGGILSVSGWFLGGGRDTRQHDMRVKQLAADLNAWAKIRVARLATERADIVNEANARGVSGGALINAQRGLIIRAGDEMHDRVRQAHWERMQIMASEDGRHAFWRFWFGGTPLPLLEVMEEDSWVARLRAHQSQPDESALLTPG